MPWLVAVYDWLEALFREHSIPLWILALLNSGFKAVLILIFIILNVLFLIWLERKISGHMQNRIGPNRVGPFGLVQTIADTIKLLLKEDIIPSRANRWVFMLAPAVAFIPGLMVYVVIPFGDGWIVRDLNVALLYVTAVSSFTVLGIVMAGWSSNNRYSMIGAMRSAAQMVSYEIPLVLSLLGVLMLSGSMRMGDIVLAQHSVWNIVVQPLGFIIFIIASTAELNRTPFDLPEAEQELVGGYNTEYSGLRWAFFFLGEFANLLAMSAIGATVFLGGWSGPSFLHPFIWFMVKTYALIFLSMWFRWTFPRVRVDQLMKFGWKYLLPASLVNLLATGLYVVVVR